MEEQARKAQYNRMVVRMMDHVENGTTDWAEDTMVLPSTEYTDEGFWKREMDAIYRKLPILVGVSQEIPKPGDFKSLELLDMPLLLARQKDGTVRVMMNVCTHRSMMLVSDETGNKRIFTCPYHGWSFNGDGSLRAVAEAAKFGDDCKGRDLVQFPCHEEGGLIFAVLDPDSDVDIRSYLGGMMDDIAAKGMESWTYVGNRVVKGANWKVAYDGYLEGYHFKAAHPETIEPRTFSNIMEFEAHGPHMIVGYPQKSILELRDVPEGELYAHENNGYDFIRLFFPNVSVFVAPEITQVAQLIPGPGPHENTTILHFLHPEEAASEEDQNARNEMADFLQGVVDREDYQVGLKIQRAMASGVQRDVIFGRNERGNQYVHRWIHHYMTGADAAQEPTL
ncbi:MAG: SRPBCC family protein [Pseudomonadota bacterium]